MKKTERKIKPTPVKKAGKIADSAGTGYSSKAAEAEAIAHPSLQEIKELIEFVSEKQFNEFELELGDFRLRWQKGVVRTVMESTEPSTDDSESVEYVPAPHKAAKPAAAPASPEEKLHVIASPIVGTFYRAASPTAEPFVKPGDPVEAGMTVCIIEAMKLMNEIPSDASGTVDKIFVENGQPVEYGQPLFGIKV